MCDVEANIGSIGKKHFTSFERGIHGNVSPSVNCTGLPLLIKKKKKAKLELGR